MEQQGLRPESESKASCEKGRYSAHIWSARFFDVLLANAVSKPFLVRYRSVPNRRWSIECDAFDRLVRS